VVFSATATMLLTPRRAACRLPLFFILSWFSFHSVFVLSFG
jgi:hypothetical protein